MFIGSMQTKMKKAHPKIKHTIACNNILHEIIYFIYHQNKWSHIF